MSHAARYSEWVATAELLARQKVARYSQLERQAEQTAGTLPATIGGLPVTVTDLAYAASNKDPLIADLESARGKAVAWATMYGLGALLDALTTTRED